MAGAQLSRRKRSQDLAVVKWRTEDGIVIVTDVGAGVDLGTGEGTGTGTDLETGIGGTDGVDPDLERGTSIGGAAAETEGAPAPGQDREESRKSELVERAEILRIFASTKYLLKAVIDKFLVSKFMLKNFIVC